MKKTATLPLIAVALCSLFLIEQLILFRAMYPKLENPLFLGWFLLGVALYSIALYLFLKYLPQTFRRLELISILCIILSLLFITLFSFLSPAPWGIRFLLSLRYSHFLLFALGGWGFFKTRRKINLSFLLWGAFLWWWLVYLSFLLYGF